MTVIQDNTNAIEFGIKAAAAWDRSQSNGDAGDALAIKAMYIAAATMTFSASVDRKGSAISETIDFDLFDWETPLYNADGSKDTKAMAARTLCVAEKLFGLKELSNAHKQRIDRAKRSAIYLSRAVTSGVVRIDTYEDAVSMKGNKLVVPYGLVHKAPIAGVDSDNDIAIYEAMKDKPCTLDGKNGASLSELSKRARPETVKRAAGEQKDKGASMMESVKFIHAIMLQNISEDGDEADIALSNEMRRALYELQTTIASYFTVDPIEAEDDINLAA